MTYYKPSLEDIRIGFEFEYMEDRDKWRKVSFGINPAYTIHYRQRIYNIKQLIENDLIRVPYLTQEDIESFHFELKAKSIDSWFQINEEKRFDSDLHNFSGYKAYNVFLNYGFHDRRLKIKGDFSGGADFGEAETLFDGECKCKNELKDILTKIHILPFYK